MCSTLVDQYLADTDNRMYHEPGVATHTHAQPGAKTVQHHTPAHGRLYIQTKHLFPEQRTIEIPDVTI